MIQKTKAYCFKTVAHKKKTTQKQAMSYLKFVLKFPNRPSAGKRFP